MSKANKQNKIPTKLKTAVLICDTLRSDNDSSHCLTLIDQWPTIWYTLNWLAKNNIEEVFVLYSQNKQEIKQFFNSYGKSIDLKYQLNYVKVGDLKTFGDAVREVQFRNLVSEDFLLMYADTVTNFDLSKMIQSHFIKKQQLKSVVLTTAFQQGYAKNIHILNSNTNQILHIHQDIQKQFNLNTQKLNLKKINIDFRRDLVPIDVFICTVEVLKSFKQSDEYNTMNQFIIGMLSSDVYEEKMNAFIIEKNQRAFRNSKASGMYLLYMSFISGYLHPYTVYNQEQLQPRQKQLKNQIIPSAVREFNKVIKRGCTISSNAKLSNNIYIGQGTVIEDMVEIKRSIILKKCKVSTGIKLQNCLLMQGCELKGNGSYSFCKFQNMGNTLKITCFKNDIIESFEDVLIDKPLFEQTPDEEQDELANYEEDLSSLIKQDPNSDSLTDLFTLRKCHNKELKQFTKDMIRILQPTGVKGVQDFVQKWGNVLLKLHDEEELVLVSLHYTCQQLQKYQKAMHVFLQFLYFEQTLSKQRIKSWFEGKNLQTSVTLSLCKPFLEKLDEESQEEDAQQDD